ncbi:NAD-dependent epimerase/dehydratase family protein [Mariprofundus ferrooxydans]|uniref:UDP-glucose 4-epimerase n=1 Tax=Mariprofundus ferrooxydans PV-1 TaxID=314345 RepID=Q0EYK4_9PROT|nr:NAD-dependent epimerase/dehydratase family protein [Mariprofundus ferrooxydans]EAU54363.1 NAD-dependent epimerase/dehydratase [Mariprofundus ferrooxydans PV-1]KON47415.1 NAD-dependent epimerase [Mariprofundus ferrooxydans]
MNVLVLGGSGFIGSHVVDHLLAAGHKVRVFDRAPERYRTALKQVEYRLGAFDDTFQVAEALQGMDAVCHLISTTVPGTSNLDPVADVQSNLINTLSLLEQMRNKDLHRILYLSSGGTVYGNPQQFPISESHPLNPISSYGVVKVAIEKYMNMYQQLYGFEPIILRPSNPYGSRQGHAGVQGLIGTLLARALSGDTLEIWGDGSVIRDYMHVSDLARLSVAALESGHSGVFNAGSGEGHSINDIIGLIRDIMSEELQVNYCEGRTFDVKEVVLDISRAKETFAWQPEISLSAGINEQLQWLRTL